MSVTDNQYRFLLYKECLVNCNEKIAEAVKAGTITPKQIEAIVELHAGRCMDIENASCEPAIDYDDEETKKWLNS